LPHSQFTRLISAQSQSRDRSWGQIAGLLQSDVEHPRQTGPLMFHT
jgi:hypothetical protein